MKKLLLLFILGVILFSGCKKDEPVSNTPEEKTNHIKAKVNGVQWEACDDQWGMFGPTVSSQYFPGSYFDMSGTDICTPQGHTIYLKIVGISGPGSFGLGGSSNNKGVFSGLYFRNDGVPRNFITDSIHSGSIIFTKFDLQNKLASGSFEFDAYNADTNITVQVREGIFNDVNILVQ